MTDSTGALRETYTHTYEGQVRITNAAGIPIATRGVGWQRGYSRYCRDDQTGRLYAGRRYDHPALGRYTTLDAAGKWYHGGNLANGHAYLANRHR